MLWDLGNVLNITLFQFGAVLSSKCLYYLLQVVYPAGGECLTQSEYDAFVRQLTPLDLSQNIYVNPNKTGYDELSNSLEEENLYADTGYQMPSDMEDDEDRDRGK